MKKGMRMMLAATLVAGLVGGGSAWAFKGDGECGGMGGRMGGRQGVAPEAMVTRHLDRLHTDLKLAPEQESAWQSWSGQMKEKASAMQDKRLEFAKLSTLSAPERAEKMLDMHKARQQGMEASLPALRAFYAKLTPEQQKVFDRSGPMGRMGEGMNRGGRRAGPPEAGPSRQ